MLFRSNLRLSNIARYTACTTIGATAFTPNVYPLSTDNNTNFLSYQYIWPHVKPQFVDFGYNRSIVDTTYDYRRQGVSPRHRTKNWAKHDMGWSGDNMILVPNATGHFNGVYQTPPDLQFGTNDFTIEFFHRPRRGRGLDNDQIGRAHV